MPIELKVKKLYPDAQLPKYSHEGDAAMDIFAREINITPNYVEYGTGLAFEFPTEYVMLIFPRSSLTNKDLMLKNSVGVLESTFRGELKLRFWQLGNQIYQVGDRIGQIMLVECPKIKLVEFEELSETGRSKIGFGSTGR